MSYLKHKPGSIEELMANEASKLNDNAYQQMFKKELDKAGKGIGGMSPKEKKDFFNKIDSKYKAKNEAKVNELSKAQEKLPPALQKAIKDKEQKEDLDNKDKSVVKDVVSALKKATKAHSGQAKDLEKAMKTEADQHGDEINDKKTKASMTKGVLSEQVVEQVLADPDHNLFNFVAEDLMEAEFAYCIPYTYTML